MAKLKNTTKGDLVTPNGILVPAGQEVDISDHEMDVMAGHPACQAWIAEGMLEAQEPEKKKAPAKQASRAKPD